MFGATEEVMELLPLNRLVLWERVIQSELALSIHAHRESAQRSWRIFIPFIGRGRNATQLDWEPFWVDLCHWNGFRRETALHGLKEPVESAFLLALVLRRLNDWVPQVRAAAKLAVSRLTCACSPAIAVDAILSMMTNWADWGRIDDDTKHFVAGILADTDFTAAFRERLVTAATGPTALALREALRTEALDLHLASIATHSVQPAVRAQAYRTILAGHATWVERRKWVWTDVRYCKGRQEAVTGRRQLTVESGRVDALKSAAADRSALVRRVAAEALIREVPTLGARALPLAELLAADCSAPVAERGRFALRQIRGALT
jgi:hypothetical protein